MMRDSPAHPRVRLKPHSDQTEQQREQEKGSEPQPESKVEHRAPLARLGGSAAEPPGAQDKHKREHSDGRLAQKSQQKGNQGKRVSEARGTLDFGLWILDISLFLKPQIPEQAEQEENQRQRVLPLRDPRNGSH